MASAPQVERAKPLMGTITEWGFNPLVSMVYGMKDGRGIRTSRVESIRVIDGVIVCETRNSLYHLGKSL